MAQNWLREQGERLDMAFTLSGEDSIEQFPSVGHGLGVRTLRTLIIVGLALAWVPLTSHCELEAVSGLEFLHCVEESSDSPPDHSHDCDDSCCSVEYATYQVQRSQELVSICILALVPSDFRFGFKRVLALELGFDVLAIPPPELAKTWQFSFRAALPVRAPSFAA